MSSGSNSEIVLNGSNNSSLSVSSNLDEINPKDSKVQSQTQDKDLTLKEALFLFGVGVGIGLILLSINFFVGYFWPGGGGAPVEFPVQIPNHFQEDVFLDWIKQFRNFKSFEFNTLVKSVNYNPNTIQIQTPIFNKIESFDFKQFFGNN